MHVDIFQVTIFIFLFTILRYILNESLSSFGTKTALLSGDVPFAAGGPASLRYCYGRRTYGFDGDGKRARLMELGPRFTLRLKSLQKGTFIDGRRHKMETSRRKFFL
ncbi:unnamed protein product [Acanthoscelides obtectus]|uniref:Uncharacterized protein n=1 Tax=Acanthoscelides obtectus TaxID=200917 RepID=A0A9P0MEW0_ACAOB|nr:unnamed protein product [Acanthoscelides obtectus]CAK1664691.1 Brix domain-containing protein F44G4.1 [Acanthoscelides obtectus]